MSNVTIEYNGKDQNRQDETTIYWFTLNGTDYGTGIEFKDEQYGVANCNGDETIVDCDGAPIPNTHENQVLVAVKNNVAVTDEMRAD